MYLKEETTNLSFNLVEVDGSYFWYCTWVFDNEKYGVYTSFKDLTTVKKHLDNIFEAYEDIYKAQLDGTSIQPSKDS